MHRPPPSPLLRIGLGRGHDPLKHSSRVLVCSPASVHPGEIHLPLFRRPRPRIVAAGSPLASGPYTISADVRSGWVAAKSAQMQPASEPPKSTGRLNSAESMTTRRSSISVSSGGASVAESRSESPIPRRSTNTTRANDASRLQKPGEERIAPGDLEIVDPLRRVHELDRPISKHLVCECHIPIAHVMDVRNFHNRKPAPSVGMRQ